MTNNDILRQIRYIFDFNDKTMIEVFGLSDMQVTRAQISNWLKKDDDPDYKALSDAQMARFLNGFIIKKRGPKQGSPVEPEKKLNNNKIFLKIKIALNLKAEDVLSLMALANFTLSKHELSAFFRKSGHKHYRECKDQILRNFFKGIKIKYRQNNDPIALEKKPKSPAYQWKKL